MIIQRSKVVKRVIIRGVKKMYRGGNDEKKRGCVIISDTAIHYMYKLIANRNLLRQESGC